MVTIIEVYMHFEYEEVKVEVEKVSVKEFVIKNNVKLVENMTKLEYNINEHRNVL